MRTTTVTMRTMTVAIPATTMTARIMTMAMRATTVRSMAAVVLVVAGLLGPAALQAQAGARPGDEAAVLGVVRTLFDGMREKDEALLRSVFHPEARLHTAVEGEDGVPATRESPVDGFIAGVLGSEAHLDEVTFDEEVRVSGNLAMAWTPYNIFVNGSFQHCGVDAFVMTRTPDGWKILQLADTRTVEGCDPERRG